MTENQQGLVEVSIMITLSSWRLNDGVFDYITMRNYSVRPEYDIFKRFMKELEYSLNGISCCNKHNIQVITAELIDKSGDIVVKIITDRDLSINSAEETYKKYILPVLKSIDLADGDRGKMQFNDRTDYNSIMLTKYSSTVNR